MRTTFLIAFIFSTLCAFAQRPLEFTNLSKEDEVYPLGKNTIARVTISASPEIRPYFKSFGVIVTPAKIDTIEDKVFYHLHFNVPQPDSRQNLEIGGPGFTPINLRLVLNTNRWYRYNIYDPDPTIVDCYHQLSREGDKLYRVGNYLEAKLKYEEISKNCSVLNETEKTNLASKLQDIDSLIIWRSMADNYDASSDYSNAIEFYKKIHSKNPEDNIVQSKGIDSQRKLFEICKIDYDKAENYFNEKDYSNAKPWYEKVRDLSCPNKADAVEKLLTIDQILNHPCVHILTYEYAKDAPFGLSSGNYKDHKISGYFTLRINQEIFEAIQTNNDTTSLLNKRPEMNVSFGWTIPVVKPVWIFFGPGYTGVGQYITSTKVKANGSRVLKINNAISPEIGLAGKIKLSNSFGFALRYTFQYRFALDKAMSDYIGKIRHVFGIGFCF